jgi:predicted Co/Zn/Cd cation transporter (cation efflux family)
MVDKNYKDFAAHTKGRTMAIHTSIDKDFVEKRALVVGAFVNLIMAACGWLTYYFSNSEAVLLDGNYSFIIFLVIIAAIVISRIKSRRTAVFPFGQYFYEALYAFIKGLMILGVTMVAIVTSAVRIVFFFMGRTEYIPSLLPGPVLYYAAVMTVFCLGLAAFYAVESRRIGGASTMLSTEARASLVDGIISLSIVVAASLLLWYSAQPQVDSGFVSYLADPIITLVLCVALIGQPIAIIKNSVIELGGGTVRNAEDQRFIEEIVHSSVAEGYVLESSYAGKTGSLYLVVLYLKSASDKELVDPNDIRRIQERVNLALSAKFHHLIVEVILR